MNTSTTASPPLADTSAPPQLLTPAEVAAIFRVDPKTVTRWAQQGKIRSLRTLGGHRRYAAADIRAILTPDQDSPPHRAH